MDINYTKSLKKIIFVLASFLFILFISPSKVAAQNAFKTGWWIDRSRSTSVVSTYGSEGNTLVLLAGWLCDSSDTTSQISSTNSYLNAAGANGMKMIVGLECGPVPSFSDAHLQTIINGIKNNSALYGYYIGDEPELSDTTWQDSLNKLSGPNGYYQKIKSLDPNHPILISFNQFYYNDSAHYLRRGDLSRIRQFFPVVDIVGMHNYPFWSTNGEFGGSDARLQYDKWRTILGEARTNGKDFIATAQGFGNNTISPYRNPTLKELRYQVFSAIVQGIDKVLFWLDSWGVSSSMLPTVAQVVGQVQSIGAEMNNGTTNDARIGVSVTDRERLVYRYGVNGTSQVILAVNIASRTSSSGAAMDVQFTLPSGVRPNQVEAVGENRSPIPVTNGVFTDHFNSFEVHAYKFTSSATPMPTNTPAPTGANPTATIAPTSAPTSTPTQTPLRGDTNGDGKVDQADYDKWRSYYNPYTNQSGGVSIGDFNGDSKVDGIDYMIWWNNWTG